MDEQHKQALVRGRREGRSVRSYLQALEEGRKSAEGNDPAWLALERRRIETRLAGGVDPLERLELIQKRTEIEHQLAAPEPDTSFEELEQCFVAVIAGYATRKGISYWALREVGVPEDVLARAGVQPDRDHPAVRLAAQRGEAEPAMPWERAKSKPGGGTRSPERTAAERLTGMLGDLLGGETPGE